NASRSASSRAAEVPMRASSRRRGALPGRKPGMLTSRAMRRNAASIAWSNSVSSTSTETLTLLSSRDSTALFTDQGAYRRAGRALPGHMRRSRSYDLCVKRGDADRDWPERPIAPQGGHRYRRHHVSGNRAMLREKTFAGGSGVRLGGG